MARQFGRVDQAVGGQQPQGNRQVKAPTVFGQVSRGQVDGDALVGRKVQPRVLQGRAHALAGFFHFGVGQPHQGEAGQTVGQMHFDAHRWCVQAQQCTALDDGQAHNGVSLTWCAWCSASVVVYCTDVVRRMDV